MKQFFLNLWERARVQSLNYRDNKIKYYAYWFTVLVTSGFVFGVSLLFLMTILIIPFLPDVTKVQNLIPAESTIIMDREGNTLYSIHGDENRQTTSLGDISPFATKAILAIEDDRFYDHIGIDVGGILKAICSEVYLCSGQRGGSTITQQFVKNAFLSPERSYVRKLREILLALRLESKFSKDQILEMYLNRINYGSNIFGVELATKTFFDKSAKDLTIAESAMLAAIPKAPSYYSPYGDHLYPIVSISAEDVINHNLKTEEDLVEEADMQKGLLGKTFVFGEGDSARSIYVKGRTDFVLDRMVELGYITESDYKTAVEELKTKTFSPYRAEIKAPHFVFYVKELLEEKYGKEQVEKGGLKVTTTIDPKLQDAAEKAVEHYAETNEKNYGATNEGLVAADPANGQILAMVGSRDFFNDEIDGKVNIALRPRLPGSSFKPIVYAAAFLQGYAPSTVLYDVKTKFGAWYEPKNYDGTYRGPVTIRQALGASLNVPAVKAGYLAGIPNVLDLARKMGIQLNQPDDWYGLSLAIGAGEARLMDMVLAYGVFASGGYKSDPVVILKVEDKNGNILEEYQAPQNRSLILDPQVAYLVNDTLSNVEARPEGFWRDRLTIGGAPVAVKTGTSNKKKTNATATDKDDQVPLDNWCIGYTSKIVAGVWAGNNDAKELFQKSDGLSTAAPIWKEFMIEALKDRPSSSFAKPPGIKYIKVSKRSGKLPSEVTPEEDIVTEVFASFSVPKEYDDAYQLIEIDKASGKLATEFTPEEAREKKAFYVHHSERPDVPDWENPVQEWAKENGQDDQPPTEYDDVHTAASQGVKPEIVIKSPGSMASVSPPTVGVWPSIDSKAGVAKVEYYFDNELVDTVEKSPFKGTIALPKDIEMGSTHTIKAIVYDSLYLSNQSSVEVRIAADTVAPTVRFIYPLEGARILGGSFMSAQVDAVDSNGDIEKVEFVLDGKPLKTVSKPPYIVQLTAPIELGDHELEATAYDHSGNVDKATLRFSIVGDSSFNVSQSAIIEPTKNSTHSSDDQVIVKIYLTQEIRDSLQSLTVFAKQDKKMNPIAEVKGDEATASSYAFIWDHPESGRYELLFKATLKDGNVRFSERIPIVIK